MIGDIMSHKRFQTIIKELCIKCNKLNISLVFITQSYFSVPKEIKLNSIHYLIMKIHNKKELQNNDNNHSADIEYKYFMEIYRKCIKEPYSFLTIDITLPANNSLRFIKNSFRFFITMTLTDELKILDGNIKANQDQYDLDREAAKISALSSKELGKYEYLTGKDLGYKPEVIEKAKFEYSPLFDALKNNKAKSKRDEIAKISKQNKYFIYNSQHTFEKFKNISDFKEMPLDSMYKKLNEIFKKFNGCKNLIPKTKKEKKKKKKEIKNKNRSFRQCWRSF